MKSITLATLATLAVSAGCTNKADDTGTGADGGTAIGMISIPAGTFTMGSPSGEVGQQSDETQHEVTLTHDFFIGATEVTQGQFESVMGYNPSYFSTCGDDCPVEDVSWDEAAAFANAVSATAGLSACYTCRGSDTDVYCEPVGEPFDCEGYRLPTEAEWDYAARAGETAAFANGGNLVSGDEDNCSTDVVLDNGALLGDLIWYCGTAGDTSHGVGTLDPNAWGLYDTSGNVWEWTGDWYDSYSSASATDPTGPSTGTRRVDRGGSWNSHPRNARVARRHGDTRDRRVSILGLRLARRGAAPSLP